MPSSDKTRKNLMASMLKTKGGTTQEKAPAKAGGQVAKKTSAKKPATSAKKPRPAKKKASKKVPNKRQVLAADPYQSNGRIWPD